MAGIEPTRQAKQPPARRRGHTFHAAIGGHSGETPATPRPRFRCWLGKNRAIPHANAPLRGTLHAASAD